MSLDRGIPGIGSKDKASPTQNCVIEIPIAYGLLFYNGTSYANAYIQTAAGSNAVVPNDCLRFDKTKFDKIKAIYFEMLISAQSGYTASAKLRNMTDGVDIPDTEITDVTQVTPWVKKRSGDIKDHLPAKEIYLVIQIKSSESGAKSSVVNPKLIIEIGK